MLTHYLISPPLIAGLLLMLSLAVFTDLTQRKIPNTLVLYGLIFSCILQCFSYGWAGALNWVLGISVGFICFFPLYLLRGMAAGDVKLMMAVGGFLGYPLVFTAALYSLIAGGVMAIMYLIYKQKIGQLMMLIKYIATNIFVRTTGLSVYDFNVSQTSLGRMPYAQAIAAGTVLAYYFKAST